MKILKAAAFISLGMIVAVFLSSHIYAMATAQSLYDNPRVLVLSGEERQIQKQLDILQSSKEDLYNRDILVYRQDHNNGLVLVERLSTQQRDFDIQPYVSELTRQAFQLALIGKDGDIKQIWSEPVAVNNINVIIDQMPMRRIEMREQN